MIIEEEGSMVTLQPVALQPHALSNSDAILISYFVCNQLPWVKGHPSPELAFPMS